MDFDVSALTKGYLFCGETILGHSGIPEKIRNFSSVSDCQLDSHVLALTNDYQFCGETMLRESGIPEKIRNFCSISDGELGLMF